MKKIYKKLIIGLLILILISSLNATVKEGGSLSSDAKTLQRWLEKAKGVMSMYVDMPI